MRSNIHHSGYFRKSNDRVIATAMFTTIHPHNPAFLKSILTSPAAAATRHVPSPDSQTYAQYAMSVEPRSASAAEYPWSRWKYAARDSAASQRMACAVSCRYHIFMDKPIHIPTVHFFQPIRVAKSSSTVAMVPILNFS